MTKINKNKGNVMKQFFLFFFLLNSVVSANQGAGLRGQRETKYDYKCPGCEKRFSRLEKYQRHIGMHNLSVLKCYFTCADMSLIDPEGFDQRNVKVPHRAPRWQRVLLGKK